MKKKEKYLVSPNIKDKSLITELKGIDENGKKIKSKVINEKSLTIFLNNQEGYSTETQTHKRKVDSFCSF